MKSSFLPQYERNILRISALASKKWLNQKFYYTNSAFIFWFDLSLEARAEFQIIFRLYFGRNDDFINLFWDLLTFMYSSVLFPKGEILFGGKVSDHFHGNLDLWGKRSFAIKTSSPVPARVNL